jgi:hypothetical protein
MCLGSPRWQGGLFCWGAWDSVPGVAILVIVPVVMLLAEYMCDFWCIQGVHQFLNLVVAHIDSMQRICGQYDTDHQIANTAQQYAPPETDSIKVLKN